MRCAKPANCTRSPRSVDPHLEIAEITDRVVKAGGPALLFTDVKGSEFPVLTNQFGTQRRMAMALDAKRLDEVGGAHARAARLSSAARVVARRRLGALCASRRLPTRFRRWFAAAACTTSSCASRISRNCRCSRPGRSMRGPFITLPLVITKDPRTRPAQRGHVPHASLQRARDRDALAAPQARPRARRRVGRKDSRRGRDRHRPGAHLRRDRAAAAGARRVRVRRTVARQAGRTGAREDASISNVPADAEFVLEGYVDNEDVRIEGPFGDHTGVYSLADRYPTFHVTCITHRRNPIYAGDRRRQTADGRRVARQSDRTDLPAVAAGGASRSRRHESSRRRRLSQSRDRFDSQSLSGPSEEGDERAVGPRPHDDAHARARDRRRRRRRAGPARAWRGSCSTTSRPSATSSRCPVPSTISITDRTASPTARRSASTRRARTRRKATRANGRRIW